MVRSRRLMDVGRVLEAAEAASPVEAVEAVARELGLAFDAVAVSFLIADLSGRALVRLAHVPLVGGGRGSVVPARWGASRGRGVSDRVAVRRRAGGAGPPDPDGPGAAPGSTRAVTTRACGACWRR